LTRQKAALNTNLPNNNPSNNDEVLFPLWSEGIKLKNAAD